MLYIYASISYDEGKTLEQDFIFDVKTTRRSASTDYNCREVYDTPHGAVDRRAAAVQKEYVVKARKADREYTSRATCNDNSDSGNGLQDTQLDIDQGVSHTFGPVETKLRELPPPVGLAFGSYCEASKEVHQLVKVVATYMAERRGAELGFMELEQKKAVFEHRLRQSWAMAALRAKARAREERMPLVGLATKAQADRLLASSVAGSWLPDSVLPGHRQNALLDALVWPEDAGTSLSREERSSE